MMIGGPLEVVMNYEIDLQIVPRENIASITVACPWTAIGDTLGTVFGEVMAYLGPLGALDGNAKAFARYVPTGEQVTIEAGFTVVDPVPGMGRVRPGELPGGEALVTIHEGPYGEVAAAYTAMQEWLTAHGRKGAEAMWEFYLTPPDVEPPRTEVVWPLLPVAVAV